MAAIVSGNSLGLLNSSLYVLGSQGALGQASQGRAGERVFVNGATGNLVIQNRDELVVGRGPDLSLLRTYNSQGLFDGDNNDNWRFGVYRKVTNLTGTVNTAGSTVTRVAEDGSESLYTYDATLGKYVCHDGGGSFDTLTFTAATQTWTWGWTDGTNQLTETYDNANGGRITRVQDQDGNALAFTYNAAGLITQVTDAGGETTFLDYTGTDLTQLRTVTGDTPAKTIIRTTYAYDTSHRLITVTTDLTPDDTADNSTYVVDYRYDDANGISKRVASLTQTDGNNLTFSYIQVGTVFKLQSYTDAAGKVTTFGYTPGTSTVTANATVNNAVLSTTDTQTTTTTVQPYYTVTGADSWTTITQAVYGTSNANAVAALQAALPTPLPSLTAGTRITVPPTISYVGPSTTANANAAALSTTVTTNTDYNLNSTLLTTPTVAWGTAAVLAGSSATSATAPQVKFDQNGNGMAVWALGADLFYSVYTKVNDTWSAAAALDGAIAGNPATPNLSMSTNGNALVTWVQNGDVYARRYTAGVWDSGATNLENLPTAQTPFNPVGAINDNGRAVVAFIQAASGTTYNLYANVFNGTWASAATAVDDIGTANANPIVNTTLPSVAIDPLNNATVLWLQKTGTQTADSLYFSRFNPSTSTWGAGVSTTLENTTTAVTAESIAFDANGNGIAIWLQGGSLLAKSYTRSSNTWSASTTLGSAASAANLSLSSNGNGLVTWVNANNILARRYAAGAWVGTASTLENAAGVASNPVGSINNAGQAAVVFAQVNGTTTDVFANRFSGGAWSTAATLIDSSANAAAGTMVPSVAIDATGNINAVWLQKNGADATDSVFRNRFNADSAPYYTVPNGTASWDSIATTLYGSSAPATQLQNSLSNPALTQGNRLSGFQGTLTVATTATVQPYYTVQSGNTWSSIAQAVYGDVAAAGPLQAALSNPALTAGTTLIVPASLSFTPVTAAVNNAALSTTDTQTTNYSLNSGALTNPAGGWAAAAPIDSSAAAASQLLMGASNDGDAVSVWMQGGSLFASFYESVSHLWSAPSLVSGSFTNISGLKLDVDMQRCNAIVTWIDATTNKVYANYGLSDGASVTWGGAQLVATATGTLAEASGGINFDGTSAVMWRATSGTTQSLMMSRWSGTAWGAAAQVASGTVAISAPEMTITSQDEILAVWRASDGTAESLFRRSFYADAWGAAAALESSSTPVSLFHIDTDIWGDTNVTFVQGNNFFITWGDAVEGWTPAQSLTSSPAAITQYAYSDSASNSIVAWITADGKVYANRWGASAPDLLGTGAGLSDVTADINGPGQAVVSWRAGNDLYVASFDGANWSTPALLESGSGVAAIPRVAIGEDGQQIAVWVQNDGAADSIFASRYATGGTGSPYYTVQTGDTWASIALALYGNSAVASVLQSAMGGAATPPLGQMTGFPATLSVTSTITVAAYYLVPSGATWATVTQAVYGTSDANAQQALRDALGNPALTAGSHITMPASIRYAGASGTTSANANSAVLSTTVTTTVAPYWTVTGTDTWASIAQSIYGTSNANAIAALQSALGTSTLAVGAHLNVPSSLSYNVATTSGANSAVLSTTVTTTVAPYYTVASGNTWASITQSVYGTSNANAVAALQSAMGNPTLTVGAHLNVPATLSYNVAATSGANAAVLSTTITTTTTVTVAPYYTVQAGDSWSGIAQNVYGDAQAGSALQTAMGGAASPTVGAHLTVPQSLSYTKTVAGGLRADITDPLGLITSILADGQGQITQILAPAVGGVRQSASYAYDANGNVTSVTDARGLVTTYGYDANGNRTLERDAAGNTITRVFGSKNELLAETSYVVPDPDGAGAVQPASPLTARYAYDTAGHLRFAVSGEGRVTEYRYNSFGQRTAAIQYTGSLYNLTGLTPTSTLTEANLTAWLPADKSASIRLDSAYDFRGQVSTTTSYAKVDAAGNGVADGTQSVTQYVYDQAGNLLKTIDPTGSATADPNDYITTYVYDGLGRLTTTTDAAGRVTLTQYDDANKKTVLTSANGLATTSTYDAKGELISVVQSFGAQTFGTTSYFYDADGRLRRTVDPTGISTHILYDEAGRKIAAVDGTGTLTEYRYDADNNLTRSIQYATALTPAQLASLSDAQGNPTAVTLSTSAAGAGIRPAASNQDRSSWNAYDSANRLVKSADELGFVTQMSYDGAGRLTDVLKSAKAMTSTAALGDTPTAASIVPAATDPLDRLTRNFYDADGKLRGTLDGEGYLIEYKYDSAGQRIETVGYATATNLSLRTTGTLAQLIPAKAAGDTHSYALYNGKGQVVGTVDGEGYFTETVYDIPGNRTQQIRYAAPVTYAAGATVASLRAGVLSLPGAAGSYASTPDSAANSITGDLDIRVLVAPSDWTPSNQQVLVGKYGALGNWGYGFSLAGGSGQLQFQFSVDGSTQSVALSSVATGFADGTAHWVRVVRSKATGEVKFYTSTDYSPGPDTGGWTQVGSTVTGMSALNVFDSTSSLRIGDWEYDHARMLSGNTYYAEVRNGIDGTVAARFNPAANAASSAATNFTSSTGEVWTLAGAASLGISGPQDQVSTYTYTALNQLATETNFEGTRTTYAYDEVGNLTQTLKAVDTADVRGFTTQYDKLGRVTAQLSGNGVALLAGALDQGDIDTIWNLHAAHYKYDAAGRRISATDADGRKTLYYYDADGRINYTIDGAGQVTQAVYNALGDLTSTVEYGTRIPAATLVNLAGGAVNTALTGAIASIASAAVDSTTTTTYTLRGQVASTTDPLQYVTNLTYDAFGDVTTRSQQIETGRTLSHTYAFDRLGQLNTTVWDTGPGGANTSETTEYDAFGRAKKTTDARGNVRTQAYDRLGRVVTTVVDQGAGRLNLAANATYDAFSRVLTQTDALGNITKYEYNAANRSIKVTTPENIVITTLKNRFGEKVSVTDGRGNTTSYQYDKEGNLSETDAPGLDPSERSYYDTGLLRRSQDAGTATVYTYDGAGRVLTVTVDPGVGHLNLATVYNYDTPLTVLVTDPKGIVTRTQYDVKGQVKSVTVDPGNLNITTTYAYDGRGKKLTVTEGAGSAKPRVTQYTYDNLGRLIKQQVDPGAVNATTTYVYDNNDNIVTKTDAGGNVTRYVYDSADRLVFTIDPLGGVTKNEYDADGNVVRVTAYAGALNPATLPAVLTVTNVNPPLGNDEVNGYVYDKDGRETFTVDALGGVIQKVYDANDNVVRTIAYANALVGGFTPGVAPQILTAPGSGSYVLADPANDRVERTVYDAVNRPVYAIDALNFVKETQYDDVGRITKTIQYVQQVNVSDAPTVAEMAAVLAPVPSTVTASNQTVTLLANPNQPYAYAASAQNDVAAAASASVGVTSGTSPVLAPPVQPYAYAATAQTDTPSAATQAVAITNTSQTNTTPPVQPYTYVASAKSDVASAASQAGTLTVQNTSLTQSGIVNNYAWYNSGGTLVTGAGMSLAVGSASAGDSTPTQVRADLYLNGVYYTTVYTDVGSANYEQWIYSPDQFDESGALVSAAHWSPTFVGDEYGYAGYHFYGVNNWNGQVNLSTGALPTGNYTVNVFTRDDYAPTPDYNTGYYDFADGTWATSNSYNITVGTIVQPTLVSWASSLQPAGTTVSFKYRPSGTGAFTSVSVGVSGANHQVNLGSIGAGNYEYLIQYTDSFGRVLKSANGTLTTTAGQTSATTGTFNFTQVSSTATAGSSISGYIPLAQVSTIDRVSTTVTDFASGAVISSGVLTYPEFEAGYNGEVNLKLGSPLANGRYNVAVTVFYKNGTTDVRAPFLYEVGQQNGWILQTLGWAAATAPAGTTPSFGYRVAGSTGAFINAAVTLSGTNHQVSIDHIAAGNYEFQIQYKDVYNRVLKSSSGTFGVTGSGSVAVNATFNFTQVSSTSGAGSSITGYITAAEVPAIDFVDATVRDLAGNVVSTARTYPEFEPSYNGRVNLKIGSVLADGAYNVSIVIHKKDGSLDTRPTLAYEVGMQTTWHPTQPYTYVASAKSDVASAASQAGTLTVQNTSLTQSGIVNNYAWYNSGGTLVTGAGMSLAVGSASAGDSTPTQVRADLYLNGVYYTTVYTDVGSANYEQWIYSPDQFDESGALVSAAHWSPTFVGDEYGYAGYHFYGVNNWNGQVNLSTGALPTGNYTVNVFTRDDYAPTPDYNTGYYDFADGTWATSNSYNITVGTIVQPTLVSWASSLQPAGTTVSFKYRPSGTGAFTSVSVGVSGANHQVNLGSIGAGNYEYLIQYTDSFGRVLKSANGTLTTTAGQTSATTGTFNFTQVSSTATAGSSISGYIPLAQVSTIDRVSTTVTDANTGLTVSSNVLTYPEFEAGYNGEVNLKLGSPLANGRYNVAVTVFYKNGTTDVRAPFVYEIGQQTHLQQTISWAASTQPAGTTVSFQYRLAGTSNPYINNLSVTTAGSNQQVAISNLPAGTYDYQILYADTYGRVVKSASSTFTITAGTSSVTTSTPFSFTQVTSTASAGSSISGYITAADSIPSIDYVEATVRDLAGNVVSTVRTYPEFEPSYNGRVNLKVGAVLADGKYNVTIVIHRKTGALETKPVLYYEVGQQPYQQRTTTVSWSIPAGVAGTTVQFSYALTGSSSTTSATVTTSGANQRVDLLNLADGQYTYVVRYFLGGQVIDQATGVFSAAPSGSSTTQLNFLADPSFDPNSAKQVNSFHYDAAGRMDSSTDAEGKTETYGYDQDGNRTSFTNKKGATWNYLYDSAGRLTSEISPLVDITNFDRDSLAMAASTARLETRMEYDALGNVTSRTEAYGRLGEARKTQYLYDAVGRQTATIYPSVNVYDSATDNLATNGMSGNVSVFEKTVFPETDVSFDALGNATVNRNASGYYSYKAYDALGRVKYEIDADKYVTEYGYDTFGNRTTTTRYAVPLDFSKAIGAFQPHTAGSAFSASEIAARLLDPAVSHTNDRTITTIYDRLDRATKVTEPAAFAFDSTAPAGSPQTFTVGRTTKNFYNAEGQLVLQRVLKNPGADTQADTADDTWEDTYVYYDKRGYRTAQVDALGYLTAWEYDETGDVTKQIEYANALAGGSWSQAAHGTPAPSGDDRVTTYRYDRKNQKISETHVNVAFSTVAYPSASSQAIAFAADHGDATTIYTYDAVGNVTSVMDPGGNISRMFYDALGRVIASTEPARQSASGGGGTVAIPPVSVSYSTLDGSPTLTFARTAPADTTVAFEYALAGTPTNQPWTPATLSAAGGNFSVRLAGLASGHYQYHILYKTSDGTIYASGTGDLNDVGGSSAASANVAAVVQGPMSVSLTSAGLYSYQASDGEGGYTTVNYWSPTNTINLSWDSLAALGGGNIRVHVSYLTYAMQLTGDDGEGGFTYGVTGNGVQTSRDFPFSANQADTGAQLTWDEAEPQPGYFGVQHINSVQVFKVVDGQEIDVTDSFASDRLFLRGKTAGLTGINATRNGGGTATTLAATALGDGIYAVDLSSLSRGSYTYTLNGVQSAGGSFEVVHSTQSSAGAVRAGVQEINPTALNHTLDVYNLPASAASVSMQFRPAGSSGAYLSKTFSAPATAGSDFTAAYDDVANGNYEYILTVTNSSGAAVNLTALGGTASGTLAGTFSVGRGGIPPVVSSVANTTSVTPLTTIRYNAFGNVVQTTRFAKAATNESLASFPAGAVDPANDQTTTNVYDSHGDLIRTVDPMGYSRYNSYDELGHVRKTWQPITDNDGLVNNAVQVFNYDGVGRQTSTVEPSYQPNQTLVTSPITQSIQPQFLSYGLAQVGGLAGDESGNWVPNIVNLAWNEMASWGGGNVYIRIHYSTPPQIVGGDAENGYVYGPPTPTYRDFEIGSAAGANGASISWEGDTVYTLDSVQVWKRDVNGTAVLLHDQNFNGTTSNRILSPAVPQAGTTAVFKYQLAGTSTWSTGTLYYMGAQYLVDTSSLPAGTYNYEILYTRPGESKATSHSQGTFTVSGISGSLTNGNSSATSYIPVAPNPADFVVNQVTYNAFGEIISKGVTGPGFAGGAQEQFEYDKAGHMWRTGQSGTPAAETKVFLYDVQGKGTAQIESQALDLKGYASASDVSQLPAAGVQRTNTLYDKLERVIGQVLPSLTIERDALEAYQAPLAMSGASMSFANSGADENGNDWIDISWSDISGLGSGNVKVDVFWATGSYTSGEFSSDAAKTGVSFGWSDMSAYTNPASEVRVWKKDAGGNWVLLFDGNGSGTNFITAPASIAGTGVSAKLNGQPVAIYNMGSQYLVNTLGWAGTYNLEVLYQRPGDSAAYAHSTASVSVSGAAGSLTPTTGAVGVSFQTITPAAAAKLDRWGNTLATTDPRYVTLDASGNPVVPDDASQAAGHTTYYHYNYLNKVTEEDRPVTEVNDNTGAHASRPVTLTYYDRMGRVLGTTDPNQKSTAYRYDAAGELTNEYHVDQGVDRGSVSFQYDALGRQTRVITADGIGTSTVYDKNNRVVSVLHPIGTDTYAYDSAGNRIKSTDANHNTTLYWYDTRGKLVRSRLPGGEETLDYYDARGNQVAETNSNADHSSSTYDYFGRILSRTDLGGHSYTYTYDKAGHVTHQVMNGIDTAYQYYANGAVMRITDSGVGGTNFYEYDAAGNRTRERYVKAGVVNEDATIAYDELGRMRTVRDNRYTTTYHYDANGNKREATTTYFDAPDGSSANSVYAPKTIDHWYVYDSMNRITLSQGSAGSQPGSVVVGQGIQIGYDAVGRRSSAVGPQGTENYIYDANGRLMGTVDASGNLTSSRTYDDAGRVIEEVTYSSPGMISEIRDNVYNSDGRMLSQTVRKGNGSRVPPILGASPVPTMAQIGAYAAATPSQVISYTGYDGMGNVTSYKISVLDGTTYTNTYTKTYVKFDGYKESEVKGTSTLLQPGSSKTDYDVNGNILKFTDTTDAKKNTSFVTDGSGRILNKTVNGKTQYYFYAGDKPVGSSGALTAADFDFNYTPVSRDYPAETPSTHIYSKGETLRSIALAVYGDAQLWYLIADANGIRSENDLQAGQQLVIPNQISNLHNNSQTYKVYSPGQIIGDTTPNLPDPPPPPQPSGHGGCGGLGLVLMVIVAVVVTVFTAGAALAVLAPELAAGFATAWGAGMGALAGLSATGASLGFAGMAAAAIGGAVGSIASQEVGRATGNVDHFSWSQVGLSAISAGVGSGIGAAAGEGGLAAKVGLSESLNTTGQAMFNAAAANAATQGVAMATGYQRGGFNWASFAASSIAAGVSQNVSIPKVPDFEFAADFANRMIGGTVRQFVQTGGKVDWESVAADAFGNALGNAIVAGIRTELMPEKIKQLDTNRGEVGDKFQYAQKAYEHIMRTGGSDGLGERFATDVSTVGYKYQEWLVNNKDNPDAAMTERRQDWQRQPLLLAFATQSQAHGPNQEIAMGPGYFGPGGPTNDAAYFHRVVDFFQNSETYIHSMAGPEDDAASARQKINYVFRAAMSEALANGAAGDARSALMYFTMATHIYQDATSPAHRYAEDQLDLGRKQGDPRPWPPEIDGSNEVRHVFQEAFTPGPQSNNMLASRNVALWFDRGYVPEGDILNWVGVDTNSQSQASPENLQRYEQTRRDLQSRPSYRDFTNPLRYYGFVPANAA